MSESSTIAERLAVQNERIVAAARLRGRAAEDVQLIAVSKRKSVEDIRAAYRAGQRDFGENYVQEWQQKAEALDDLPDLRWHFIGHLQSNKVRFLVGRVHRVHTVSSAKLVRELGKRLERWANESEQGAQADPLGVLVEVNVGGEQAKSGCAPDELGRMLDALAAESRLDARGLMTIPPATDDPNQALPFFEQLVTLRDRYGGARRLPELSMGMSADAEVAIAAGATWVRIGTAIFGARPPLRETPA